MIIGVYLVIISMKISARPDLTLDLNFNFLLSRESFLITLRPLPVDLYLFSAQLALERLIWLYKQLVRL